MKSTHNGVTSLLGSDHQGCEEFVEQHVGALRHVLVSIHGAQRAQDVLALALEWVWETWPRALSLDHPVAYLVRVGASRIRSWDSKERGTISRWHPYQPEHLDQLPDLDLEHALTRISERQRLSVVLVSAFGWRYRDVADLLGISLPTVQVHHRRGLRALRAVLNSEELT
ncbi:MAG: RNA polymerase sigma factor [Actinobacteria bacterium]|nr:RNA polymerase sigma factor [Actinomycetota bacterium]